MTDFETQCVLLLPFELAALSTRKYENARTIDPIRKTPKLAVLRKCAYSWPGP